MQISAITEMYYTRGFDSVKKQSSNDTSATFMPSFEQKLFSDITEWKTFCQKQILNNNIDYIA